jgi:hypothetical protein
MNFSTLRRYLVEIRNKFLTFNISARKTKKYVGFYCTSLHSLRFYSIGLGYIAVVAYSTRRPKHRVTTNRVLAADALGKLAVFSLLFLSLLQPLQATTAGHMPPTKGAFTRQQAQALSTPTLQAYLRNALFVIGYPSQDKAADAIRRADMGGTYNASELRALAARDRARIIIAELNARRTNGNTNATAGSGTTEINRTAAGF